MAASTVIAVIMGLLIVGLIGGILYMQSRLEQSEISCIENPYHLLKTCPGDLSVPNALPATADLQRKTFSTINWCMTNSPTRILQEKLRVCTEVEPMDIENYSAFYADTYMPPCEYAWKTAEDIPAKNNVVNDDSTQQSLNSTRDPFAAVVLDCGAKLGMLGQNAQYPGYHRLFAKIS